MSQPSCRLVLLVDFSLMKARMLASTPLNYALHPNSDWGAERLEFEETQRTGPLLKIGRELSRDRMIS
jgi:hypothetical protein